MPGSTELESLTREWIHALINTCVHPHVCVHARTYTQTHTHTHTKFKGRPVNVEMVEREPREVDLKV